MTRSRFIGGCVVCVLLVACSAGPASAGVYPRLDRLFPELGPPLDVEPHVPYRNFLASWRDLTSLANPTGTLRQKYLDEAAALERRLAARDDQTGNDVDDRLTLGALLLRVREFDRARQIFTAAERLAPDRYDVLADLAVLYQELGFFDRARDYQLRSLAHRPRGLIPGRTSAEVNREHQAEEFQLKLLEVRVREQRSGGAAVEDLNGFSGMLFAGLALVGRDESYRPGEMPADSRGSVPDNAIGLIEDSLLRTPLDADYRLSWLLAELLNARGDVIDASDLMNTLVNANQANARPLRRHRLILNEARGTVQALKDLRASWVLTPRRAATGGPCLAPLLGEAVWVGIMAEAERRANPLLDLKPELTSGEIPGVVAVRHAPAGSAAADGRSSPPNWVPDQTRLAWTGVSAAGVLLILAFIQGYVLGRRRR